jgi:hypothetical protein
MLNPPEIRKEFTDPQRASLTGIRRFFEYIWRALLEAE